MFASVVAWLSCVRGREVAVPYGWHVGVELAGVVKELLRPPMVASGVSGLSVKDQSPGGDLPPVLLPQLGAGGVQGGGLVDELLGLVQVPCPICLVGGNGRAVGLHAAAVVPVSC